MFDLEGENGYKLHRELNSYSAWSPNSTVSLEHLKEKQDCYGHLLCKCTHIRIEKNINAKTLVRNQRNNIALLHAKLPKRRIILCNDMSNSALIKIQKSIQNDLNVTESMETKQEIINPLAGGGIAAAAALAAQRIQNKKESTDGVLCSSFSLSKKVDLIEIPISCSFSEFIFTFELLQEFLELSVHSETLILNDYLLEKLDLITEFDISEYVINSACGDVEADPHDVASYLCLHRIYRERFIITKSSFDKENAIKTLATSIDIIDHSNAVGMVGWLNYGKSHDLHKSLERPFEILASLASFHALSKDWSSSTNVLRSLILRCEQHLPLYHPITITTLIDLAAAMMENGEIEGSIRFSQRARNRLMMYLNEQEDGCMMMHSMNMELKDEFQNDGEEYYKLVGLDHLEMLKAFVLSMDTLVEREMMSLLRGNHPMKCLYFCFVGDSYSVLASSLSTISKHTIDHLVRPEHSSGSTIAWATAGKFYRKALRGWVSSGVCHPDVMSTTCSLARCLKELGRMNEALNLLSSVINSSLQKLQHCAKKRKFRPKIFEAVAKCIWTLATYTAEDKPNQEGRISCMKLLKTAIELLEDNYKKPVADEDLLKTFKMEFNNLMKGKGRILSTHELDKTSERSGVFVTV